MSARLTQALPSNRVVSEFAIRERHLRRSLATGEDQHVEVSLERLKDSFDRLSPAQQAKALEGLPGRVQLYLRGELCASEVQERVANWLSLQARKPAPPPATTPAFAAARAEAHRIEADSLGRLTPQTAAECLKAYAAAAACDPDGRQSKKDLQAFAQRLANSPHLELQALAFVLRDGRVPLTALAEALPAPVEHTPNHRTTPLGDEDWRALGSALTKQKTTAEITSALAAQGFVAQGEGVFARGPQVIALQPMRLAQLEALELKAGERSGCLVNGALVGPEAFAQMKQARDETLARYLTARRAEHLTTRSLSSLEDIKRFVQLGRDAYDRMALFADKRFFFDLKQELQPLLKQLRAKDTKVVLYFEGHDAAGKTSTGKMLLDALRSAGFDIATTSFKAPSEAERLEPRMLRFQRALDANPGVAVMDRGYAGDFAYGTPPGEALAEVHEFERRVKDSKTVMAKFLLEAEEERQATTFGRRWARFAIASELAAEPTRSDEERHALLDTAGISPNDMPAFVAVADIVPKFSVFAEANSTVIPWHRIDTTSRVDARTQVLKIFATVCRQALET